MTGSRFGNAADEGKERRGWFVGHFMPEGDLRRSSDVELKWGIHPAGDERVNWLDTETRTTVVLLIEGRFCIKLSDGAYVLCKPGDYVMWGPGTGHSWRAEEDSVVVTIRWPSAAPASPARPA
ncbi:MAG TPA: signal peptidase I [Candidatus Dormibacteraeota bacterium]|nr:signal peptidase I [Candidatus Dormibacteraeota bacterium]